MAAARAAAAALLLLHPGACAGAEYKAVRLLATRLRGQGTMTQLAELELCARGTIHDDDVTCDAVANYRTPAYLITQASSDNPHSDSEGADKAADGSYDTKWLDDQAPATLTLTFQIGEKKSSDIVAFRLVTGDDEPDRDPVAWTMQGTQGGTGVMWVWTDIHSCTDCAAAVPVGRKQRTKWFALPGIPSGPRRKPSDDDLGVSGCSGGCAFLIVFFIGGFTYFAAGAAINYKKYEKRGVEMVPHMAFWKDLPSKVKDGVLFARSKARGEYAAV